MNLSRAVFGSRPPELRRRPLRLCLVVIASLILAGCAAGVPLVLETSTTTLELEPPPEARLLSVPLPPTQGRVTLEFAGAGNVTSTRNDVEATPNGRFVLESCTAGCTIEFVFSDEVENGAALTISFEDTANGYVDNIEAVFLDG